MNRTHNALSIVAAGLAIVCVLGALTALSTPAAWANNPCPATQDYQQDAATFQPAAQNVFGVRAPIEMRLDGTACYPDGFNAVWIAVQNAAHTQLAQIGETHILQGDTGAYCRFYATGAGAPVIYKCGTFQDGQLLYFRVNTVQVGVGQYMEIDDCGTNSGYTGCTGESASQPKWANSIGVLVGETNYGGSGCATHIMGSSTNMQNIGTANSPAQWIQSLNGSPSKKTLGYFPQEPDRCQYYGESLLSGNQDGVVFWDARNSV